MASLYAIATVCAFRTQSATPAHTNTHTHTHTFVVFIRSQLFVHNILFSSLYIYFSVRTIIILEEVQSTFCIGLCLALFSHFRWCAATNVSQWILFLFCFVIFSSFLCFREWVRACDCVGKLESGEDCQVGEEWNFTVGFPNGAELVIKKKLREYRQNRMNGMFLERKCVRLLQTDSIISALFCLCGSPSEVFSKPFSLLLRPPKSSKYLFNHRHQMRCWFVTRFACGFHNVSKCCHCHAFTVNLLNLVLSIYSNRRLRPSGIVVVSPHAIMHRLCVCVFVFVSACAKFQCFRNIIDVNRTRPADLNGCALHTVAHAHSSGDGHTWKF